MANFLGDYAVGDVIYVEVCFVDGSTATPTAVVSGSAMCKRMGTANVAPQGVGAITTSGGLCTLAIFTASSSLFFVKGDYSVYMGGGTVSGTSVIGYTLAQFSIGRTTAITYSSNVLNWNGGAVANAATGIPKVDIDTIKTNPVVNGGTITFPTTAILASTTNITAGTITTATNLTNAPTVGDFTSTMKTSIQTAVTAVTLSADVLRWTGTLVSAPATAGIPEVNVKNINNVATTPVTTIKAVQGLTTADQVTTAVNLTTNNDKTGYALTAPYDFAKGTVAMTESYAADLATMTPIQALHMIWANAAQFAITSTSISVKKLDGTTEAMNFNLDSSVTPTLRDRNV